MADKQEQKSAEPKELQTLDLERQVCTVRFSPDGNYLIAGGYDALIRRFDFSGEEPQALEPIAGHNGWVQRTEFSPDGKTLYAADSWGRLAAWDYAAEKPSARWEHEEAHDGWIRAMQLSADGERIITAGRDQRVRIWSASDGKLLHELADHDTDVYAAALHPDGKCAVSADLLGRVKIWRLADGACEREFDIAEMHVFQRDQDVAGIHLLAFHDDGKTLICAGFEPVGTGRAIGVPTMRFYDWKSLELKDRIQQGEQNQGIVFDFHWRPEGYWAVATSGQPGNGQVFFHRPGEEQSFYVNAKLSNCHALTFHPDNRRFVVAATNRGSQGNGAVRNEDGSYRGNFSPLHVFEL